MLKKDLANADDSRNLIFASLTFILVIICIIMGCIANENNVQLESSELYAGFVKMNISPNAEVQSSLYGIVTAGVVITVNIVIDFLADLRTSRQYNRMKGIELIAKLHFFAAFCLPSFVLLGFREQPWKGTMSYVLTANFCNSCVMHGGVMLVTKGDSKLLQFPICMFAVLCYMVSTICETIGNLFYYNQPQGQVLNIINLVFSVPLYSLGIIAIYLICTTIHSLIRSLPISERVIESSFYAGLLLSYLLCVRVMSLSSYVGNVRELNISSVAAYSWVHVIFLIILSTIPAGILRLRIDTVSILATMKESENVQLRSLTDQLKKEKRRALTLLYNMVPSKIAHMLSEGIIVEPKAHKHAVIFFSNISGFATSSCGAAPIEVFGMLDSVVFVMDACVSLFQMLYKVETAGGSYMVSSDIVTSDESTEEESHKAKTII